MQWTPRWSAVEQILRLWGVWTVLPVINQTSILREARLVRDKTLLSSLSPQGEIKINIMMLFLLVGLCCSAQLIPKEVEFSLKFKKGRHYNENPLDFGYPGITYHAHTSSRMVSSEPTSSRRSSHAGLWRQTQPRMRRSSSRVHVPDPSDPREQMWVPNGLADFQSAKKLID